MKWLLVTICVALVGWCTLSRFSHSFYSGTVVGKDHAEAFSSVMAVPTGSSGANGGSRVTRVRNDPAWFITIEKGGKTERFQVRESRYNRAVIGGQEDFSESR